MANLNQIKEHMEIVGADGAHIGIVDKIEGDRIKSVGPTAQVKAPEGAEVIDLSNATSSATPSSTSPSATAPTP